MNESRERSGTSSVIGMIGGKRSGEPNISSLSLTRRKTPARNGGREMGSFCETPRVITLGCASGQDYCNGKDS